MLNKKKQNSFNEFDNIHKMNALKYCMKNLNRQNLLVESYLEFLKSLLFYVFAGNLDAVNDPKFHSWDILPKKLSRKVLLSEKDVLPALFHDF